MTKRAKIISAGLGLLFGFVLFVALPMYGNYKERGCVFLECPQ